MYLPTAASRVAAALILVLLVSLSRAGTTYAQDERCFPETNQCIAGRFRQYWEQNGGLAVFGFPLTPAGNVPAADGVFLTQYFERSRFEYHPDKQPPYDVTLGRLGHERLQSLGRDWQGFAKASPDAPHYFEATGHAIAHEPFWLYWESHGLRDFSRTPFERSLALFGMPLSGPTLETNASGQTVLTQWFERARFEDHGPSGILLGRLGDEMRPTHPLEPAPVPPDIPEPAPPAPPPAPPQPPGGDKVVYLTFDDGPFAPWTRQILDVLVRYNARATFFAVGRQVPAHSDLVREASKMGFTFANHTYNHISLAGVSRETFRNEVLATAQALEPYEARCLRPPYAHMDANTAAYALELGYQIVTWDIDPYDWRRPGVDAIAGHVIANVAPGKVVLLHDGGGDRSQTVAALETILSTLTARGYRFEALCH